MKYTNINVKSNQIKTLISTNENQSQNKSHQNQFKTNQNQIKLTEIQI